MCLLEFNSARGGPAHDKADRAFAFFLQMRNQAGGARQQRDTLEGCEREASVEHYNRDRAIDVDRQFAAYHFGQSASDCSEHFNVLALDTLFLRDRQQAMCTRIPAGMLRMAKAGNGFLFSPQFGNPCFRCLVIADAFIISTGNAFRLETPGDFSAAQNHRTAAEKARRDGTMKRFWCCGKCHPGGHDAWHEPMLGNRAQDRIGQSFLLRVGHMSGYQKPEIAGEIELADSLLAQVHPRTLMESPGLSAVLRTFSQGLAA